jgi:DNA-binding transcriptional LysR family regulator
MVEVRLEQMATPRQLQGLTEGRVDVAFLRPRSRYPTGIAVVWLLREPIWIALRHDHPLILGENSTLTAASLAEEAFIVPGTEKGSGLHEQVAAVGQHGGFEPRIASFTLDFVAVITMVAAGFGIAVVPASVRSLLVPGVTYRALSDIAVYAGLAAAYRHNERSPIVRDLIRGCPARC